MYSALPRSLLLSSRLARQAKREEFRETNLRELKRKLSPDKQTSPKVQHALNNIFFVSLEYTVTMAPSTTCTISYQCAHCVKLSLTM